MSSEKRLIFTPIAEEREILELKVGDVFFLSGLLITARDAVHRRFLIEGEPLPINLKNLAILHAGPIMKKVGERWKCISIGPTTSMRMESYESDFIERTGVKIIVGKGGMGKRTAEACKKHRAIYAIFPGGCGVLGASKIEEVLDVKWEDLGMPEALWVLKVKEFGPLIVSIDAWGNNISEGVTNEVSERAEVAKREASEKLKRGSFHI